MMSMIAGNIEDLGEPMEEPMKFNVDDEIHDIMISGLEKIAQSKNHEDAVRIAEKRLKKVRELHKEADK